MSNGSKPQQQRRRHLRIPADVTVDLQSYKEAAPLRAKTTNLSLGGCYVKMMFTLEVGTKVKLTLWIDAAKVSTDAVVVSRKLHTGNGIQFTSMAAEDSMRLKNFLAAIR
jgi:c-di-GMP-binding flagellar brake protein YcgR